MGNEEHRRQSDSEAFLFQIVADQARITTKVEILHDMVKLQLDDHKTRIIKLEDAIVGSTTRPGLLELNRNLVKDIAKLFMIISAVGFVLYKVVSPIYDAWVNRWVPQKIASQVAQQPEVKSKIVRKTITPKPAIDIEIKKQ